MPDIIFSSIVRDLKAASKTTGHPFRYVTLATTDILGHPVLRTVVLRSIDDELTMMIYSDKRSKKIAHIKEQNVVSLLFLDKERQVQVTMHAKAEVITNKDVLNTTWNRIPQRSKKNYTTYLGPGKIIKNTDAVDYLDGKHYFSAIKIIPHTIEYLRLKSPNHIRVLFKKEHNTWRNTFLVP